MIDEHLRSEHEVQEMLERISHLQEQLVAVLDQAMAYKADRDAHVVDALRYRKVRNKVTWHRHEGGYRLVLSPAFVTKILPALNEDFVLDAVVDSLPDRSAESHT